MACERAGGISKQALQRMPYYLQYLKEQHRQAVQTISAPSIAAALRLNEVQVRKDLAAVSKSGGKPKSGFPVEALIEDMEEFLGYRNTNEAILVGVGSLGHALLSYRGFEEYGINIVAAFDTNSELFGTQVAGKSIFPMAKLPDVCKRLNTHIGIITVPADQAQAVADRLVEGGILAIWNFAPTHLRTPESILVQNENMAASLALLSKHLDEVLDL